MLLSIPTKGSHHHALGSNTFSSFALRRPSDAVELTGLNSETNVLKREKLADVSARVLIATGQ